MNIELSIVMPCLNKAETLERCIRKARCFLDRNHVEGEIVVGDNGSTDGSQAIARRCGAVVVDVPVRGYGAARRGTPPPAASTASWAIRTTATTSPSLVPFLIGCGPAPISSSATASWAESLPAPCPGKSLHRQSDPLRRRAIPVRSARSGLSLRVARLLQGGVRTHGPSHDRHGVRLGDGRQGRP